MKRSLNLNLEVDDKVLDEALQKVVEAKLKTLTRDFIENCVEKECNRIISDRIKNLFTNKYSYGYEHFKSLMEQKVETSLQQNIENIELTKDSWQELIKENIERKINNCNFEKYIHDTVNARIEEIVNKNLQALLKL